MFVNTGLCIGVYLHSVFVERMERFVTETNLDSVQRLHEGVSLKYCKILYGLSLTVLMTFQGQTSQKENGMVILVHVRRDILYGTSTFFLIS